MKPSQVWQAAPDAMGDSASPGTKSTTLYSGTAPAGSYTVPLSEVDGPVPHSLAWLLLPPEVFRSGGVSPPPRSRPPMEFE